MAPNLIASLLFDEKSIFDRMRLFSRALFIHDEKVIKAISTLDSKQEKLILLLQCIPGRIQHLLAAVPPSISRDYARQHDEALADAMADALELGALTERDQLLLQRKISHHGLRMHSMEHSLDFFSQQDSCELLRPSKPPFHILHRYCNTLSQESLAVVAN